MYASEWTTFDFHFLKREGQLQLCARGRRWIARSSVAALKPRLSSSSDSMSWFYESNGASLGPVTEAQIVELFCSGALDGLSLVWSPELGGAWKPLSEVDSLKSALRAAQAREDGDDSPTEAASLPVAPVVADNAAPSAASAPQSDAWFYADLAGERVGPVPAAAMASLVAAEQVNASTLVWREGFDAWRAASSVSELAALFGPAPPATGAKRKRQERGDSSATSATTEAEQSAEDNGARKARSGAAFVKAKENPWVYIVGA
jgi:hypothetical protein